MLDCWTGIEFLRMLQDLREALPQFFTDFFLFICIPLFFKIIPFVLFPLMFWLVDKRKGEFCLMNYISALVINNTLKFIVRQPRPYVIDPELNPVVRENDYSMPSTHVMSYTTSYGSLAVLFGNKWVRIVLISFIALVVFGRMYLGVHTPLDIIVGLAIAIGIIAVNMYLLGKSYESDDNYYRIGFGYVIAAAVIVATFMFTSDSFSHTYMIRLGMIMGLVIGRLAEHRYVGFESPDVPLKNLAMIGVVGIFVFWLITEVSKMIGNPAVSFAAGIIAMFWCVVIYPYIIKNKLPGTAIMG